MLTGYADLTLEIRSRRQFPDHRSKFDRFWSRPEDKKDIHAVLVVSLQMRTRPQRFSSFASIRSRGLGKLTDTVGQTGHVDDNAAHQFFPRDLPEPRVSHQDRYDVRLPHRSQGLAE